MPSQDMATVPDMVSTLATTAMAVVTVTAMVMFTETPTDIVTVANTTESAVLMPRLSLPPLPPLMLRLIQDTSTDMGMAMPLPLMDTEATTDMVWDTPMVFPTTDTERATDGLTVIIITANDPLMPMPSLAMAAMDMVVMVMVVMASLTTVTDTAMLEASTVIPVTDISTKRYSLTTKTAFPNHIKTTTPIFIPAIPCVNGSAVQ